MDTAKRDAMAAFQAFAEQHMPGDIALAAARGYDVSSAVIDYLIDLLPPGDRVVYKEGARDSCLISWSERESPSRSALELEEHLACEVGATHRPSCVRISVGRIVRVSDQRDGTKCKWTAVPIFISSPLTGERVVLYRAE